MKLYDTIKYAAISAVLALVGCVNESRYYPDSGMRANIIDNYTKVRFEFGNYNTTSSGVEGVQGLIRKELREKGLEGVQDLPKGERKGFLNSIGAKLDQNGDRSISPDESMSWCRK